ncbi:hypothetical protein [Nocardia africana]|uniref:Transposase IS4-like domain-containing protein n=1 Tax=Nocardia africana TaxID=134964 RepID=A0A378X1F1_9NOCA|nr:hypothetical protein [Nocardia africana]MCC3311472.1 hypothetical protein [Nocardia africana]SUA47269.1 Uncharacterised protein [Nocardia africana]
MTDIERQRIRRHRARGLDTVPEGVIVRVVEYEVTNRDSDQPAPSRLITTLVDPAEVTAAELAAAYHCRWEFETSLAEIETASAAATGCCAQRVMRWCVGRSGVC